MNESLRKGAPCASEGAVGPKGMGGYVTRFHDNEERGLQGRCRDRAHVVRHQAVREQAHIEALRLLGEHLEVEAPVAIGKEHILPVVSPLRHLSACGTHRQA